MDSIDFLVFILLNLLVLVTNKNIRQEKNFSIPKEKVLRTPRKGKECNLYERRSVPISVVRYANHFAKGKVNANQI